MRYVHSLRAITLWRAIACSPVVLCACSAAAQTLPTDSVRVDTLVVLTAHVDTLQAVAVPPLAPDLNGAPRADSVRAQGPGSTGVAPPARIGAATSAASPALPRVELISTARPVVLVRGAGSARPAAPPIESARVQVDAEGRRTLVYSERLAPAPDIGAGLGCGPGAERALIRLGNLSTDLLVLGDEGPVVGAAQQLLCVAGYAVPPDGRFDVEMEAAILAFQSDINASVGPDDQLVVSGLLDEQTRRALEDHARTRLAP